jgi:flavin-dependent dehydrogenase
MQPVVPESDLVIVGGGPAGCAAAIAARSYDLTVVLLERNAAAKLRPGEAAHPGIEPLLIRLGVMDAVQKAGFLRYEGHWVKWGGEPLRFMPFGRDAQGEWRGFQLWRPDFDAILLAGAMKAGARIVRPCGELRLVVEGNRVGGVETPVGAWRSAFVIDATGRRRWLARTLDLEIGRQGPRRVVWYNYAEGECPSVDQKNPMIASDAVGWTWLARVRPNLYQWVRVLLEGARLQSGWCPEEFAGLRPIGQRRGIDVASAIANPAAGPGYFLAGDAASVVDPLSSHGMLKALMSGMNAAHYAASVLRYGVTPHSAASAYNIWLREWFRHDSAHIAGFYRELGAAIAP